MKDPKAASNCEWNAENRCIHCGYQARRVGTRRNCMGMASSTATVREKVTRYAMAVARWLAAGSPRRSDDEVAELLAICQACPTSRYDAARESCKRCGCKVNANGWGLVNKLRMATEDCPDGHW